MIPGRADEGLEALRDSYAASLPGKLAEIERFWSEVSSTAGGAALRSLHRAVHSITGSAGTYGFAEISREARAFELAIASQLEAPLDPEPLALRLAALRRAMEAARAGSRA